MRVFVKKLAALFNRKGLRPGQVINLLKFRYLPKKPVLGYDPVILSVDMTSRCTLACDMCQTHSQLIPQHEFRHRKAKDIDFETFKQFVDRFKNASTVLLIGTGEPLLNSDFCCMARYASSERRMRVETVTNGTILGEKIKDLLDCSVDSVGISLNGHNAEEFQRMTGQDSRLFERICANVRELVRTRNEKHSSLRISVSFILDQQNYRNIFEMIKVAEELGVDEASFHNFLPSDVPLFTAEERCLYADDEDVLKTSAEAKQGQYSISVHLPLLLDRTCRNRDCKTYFRLLRIDGEGNVGGCATQLLNLSGTGHFLDDNVWNNQHFQERRRLFLNPDLPELAPCRNCCSNHGITIEEASALPDKRLLK